MRLTPREPNIPLVGGFTDENDIFRYKGFAGRLSNLVQNIDEPLVVVLDGPLGSGKSTFVKQWAGLLRERGATVIHFDAFGSDHHEDAFIAISAAIHDKAREVLGGNESRTRRYLNTAKKLGKAIMPLSLKISSRAATAGILSLEDIEEGGEVAKAAISALGNESAKVIEKVVSERLRAARDDRAAIESFREALTEVANGLSDEAADEQEKFPLVFIIDELDRCRPPFALSAIERVKHLFTAEGVCFVLVTHMPQLETIVQGNYGEKFDAKAYLEKFYQLRVRLPEVNIHNKTPRQQYIERLWRSLDIHFPDVRKDDLVMDEIATLAEVHALTLRQIERVMSHVVLVAAAFNKNHLFIPPIGAGLCVMRLMEPTLFEKARRGELTWEQGAKFIRPNGFGEFDDWIKNWWGFVLDGPMTETEKKDYSNNLARYAIRDPRDIVSFTAAAIEELSQAGRD